MCISIRIYVHTCAYITHIDMYQVTQPEIMSLMQVSYEEHWWTEATEITNWAPWTQGTAWLAIVEGALVQRKWVWAPYGHAAALRQERAMRCGFYEHGTLNLGDRVFWHLRFQKSGAQFKNVCQRSWWVSLETMGLSSGEVPAPRGASGPLGALSTLRRGPSLPAPLPLPSPCALSWVPPPPSFDTS